jgi:hypothetical protein
MRRVIAGLAAIMLLISPAYAQSREKGGAKRPDNSQQTEDKKKKEAAAEKAYKDALRSIPIKKLPIRGRKCASSGSESKSLQTSAFEDLSETWSSKHSVWEIGKEYVVILAIMDSRPILMRPGPYDYDAQEQAKMSHKHYPGYGVRQPPLVNGSLSPLVC